MLEFSVGDYISSLVGLLFDSLLLMFELAGVDCVGLVVVSVGLLCFYFEFA